MRAFPETIVNCAGFAETLRAVAKRIETSHNTNMAASGQPWLAACVLYGCSWAIKGSMARRRDQHCYWPPFCAAWACLILSIKFLAAATAIGSPLASALRSHSVALA